MHAKYGACNHAPKCLAHGDQQCTQCCRPTCASSCLHGDSRVGASHPPRGAHAAWLRAGGRALVGSRCARPGKAKALTPIVALQRPQAAVTEQDFRRDRHLKLTTSDDALRIGHRSEGAPSHSRVQYRTARCHRSDHFHSGCKGCGAGMVLATLLSNPINNTASSLRCAGHGDHARG